MKIILLSGGSGKRLWPLSNDARSKQFLRLLTGPDGEKESMIQRVVRQIKAAGITRDIVVATGANQKDSIENQLGDDTTVVTEPCRRDTFPAIVLACSYLKSTGVDDDEPVIVMPCDQFTEDKYFAIVKEMGNAVERGFADLLLLGIKPTYPSSKYGYIVPCADSPQQTIRKVDHFTEKPDVDTARRLIAQGAMWNGGVFAFRLGYLMKIAGKRTGTTDFTAIREHYGELPKISFDYEVVEKAKSIAVIEYDGQWKDLGTWNTLTDEISTRVFGNIVLKNSDSSYAYNELEIPIVCIGAEDMVIAATYDGILVSRRSQTEDIKDMVSGLCKRPMYEERRWGEYKVIDYTTFPDGHAALTKQLTLHPGKSISYQRHNYRSEVWTFIDGEGLIVIDGETRKVSRGDVINIPVGRLHALKAITPLTFIEVQSGANLVEEDIERFPWDW